MGLAMGRAPRGCARLAGVTMLLLAVSTVVGLYLGAGAGAVTLGETLYSPLGLVFIAAQVVSGFGLMRFASRVGR